LGYASKECGVQLGSPRNLLKRHFEMMAELERVEKRMAELIRKLQENADKLELLGFSPKDNARNRQRP